MNTILLGGIVAAIFGAGFVSAVVLLSVGFAILAGLALAIIAVVSAALLILTTRRRRAVLAPPPTLFAART